MIEYPDISERQAALEQLLGIERALRLQVGVLERVIPVANEVLQRAPGRKPRLCTLFDPN